LIASSTPSNFDKIYLTLPSQSAYSILVPLVAKSGFKKDAKPVTSQLFGSGDIDDALVTSDFSQPKRMDIPSNGTYGTYY